MSNKSENFKVEEHKCTIHMFDGRTITGKINISSLERLSDVFAKDQSSFVIIYDATIGVDDRKRTFFLNKSGIAWAEPEEPEIA